MGGFSGDVMNNAYQTFNKHLLDSATAPKGITSNLGALESPFYDSYTASRRANYSPFGPNQQFYQPIYRPSYGQFSPLSQFQQPTYNAPLQSPQPMQSQFRPIPFMNQTQIDARQAAANPPAPSYADSGFKQGGAVDDGIASLLKK